MHGGGGPWSETCARCGGNHRTNYKPDKKKLMEAEAPAMYDALKQVVEISEDGDTGADFGRVADTMWAAAAILVRIDGAQ